jgi:hypothetical protein
VQFGFSVLFDLEAFDVRDFVHPAAP